MDTSKEYIAMCEEAKEIQDFFSDTDNRIEIPVWFYQYPGKGTYWEVPERVGIEYGKEYSSERTKVVWLPSQDQLQDFSSAFGISGLLYEFNDFVFGIPKTKDIDLRYSVLFRTVEQLWLAFIMQGEWEKHWDGERWTSI